MAKKSEIVHRWKFYRAGGVDQVVIEDGADIANLHTLDHKLWVALACPVKGTELDTKTLELMDSDKDGRIRAPEVLSSIAWLKKVLRGLDALLDGSDVVALDSIDDKSPEGKSLLAGAKRILANLDKADADVISLDDVANTERIFVATKFNGDGVIPVDAASDAEVRKVLEEIIAIRGAVKDRSGKPGVDQATVDAFFKEAAALDEWQSKGEKDKAIRPYGEKTDGAAAATRAVAVKIDDFFARCRLAAFDARAAARLNREESEYVALAAKDLKLESDEIARLPLAQIEAGRNLPLDKALNPAWDESIQAFRKNAVAVVLGGEKNELTEAQWRQIKTGLAPFDAWVATKPATTIEKLGIDRVRQILAKGAKATIDGLIAQDKALEEENARIVDVHKLVLLHRDLMQILRNFVNFADFYSKKGAVFQAGTLYLDGRSCDLCVRVDDAGRHAALAGLAKSYLAYCDCVRPASGEKMTIAAAFTDGDSDHLMVSRNGLFFDRKGRDWDATITKIIENPISIREAFWSPYKRFVRMIEEQVAKRAGAAQDEASKKVESAAVEVANIDKTKSTADPAKPPEKKIDVGTVAAIGVAIGGIATFFSSVLATFLGLGKWVPLGVVAVLLAISGPSMLIAWLKLRQRNLGPILDANGWAVNGRVRINVPFGGALTSVATLPPGAQRSLTDPYAERQRPWGFYVTLLVIVGLLVTWYIGKLDNNLPKVIKSTEVFGKYSWSELTKDEKKDAPTPGSLIDVPKPSDPPEKK